MGNIVSVRGFRPEIGKHCFIAPNAMVIGQVTLDDYSSVWFGAVLRGDVNAIYIGEYSNIQDNVTVHCTYQKTITRVGAYVTVGHNAVLHGCQIDDYVLVGMGAVIMDNAHVESGVIIAAGAVVPPGAHLRSGFIYGGVPARPLKPIDVEKTIAELRAQAERYVQYARWYLEKDK